jgi:hypothetical protein
MTNRARAATIHSLDVTAILTRHRAVAFLHAAIEIQPRSAALKPKYFVFSHSIELAFKAFLMANGHYVDFCTKKLSHDLMKASALAETHLLTLSDHRKAVLQSLALQHSRPYSFRYFDPQGWSAPSFLNVERICRRILKSTQGKIFEVCRIPLRPEHRALKR